jgi:hypothetical protein
VAEGIGKVRRAYDYLEAYQEGYSSTLKSTGWKRIFTGKADDELRTNFRESFTRTAMGQARPISGYETEVERQLYEIAKTKSSNATISIENVRLENVLRDLRNSGIDGATYDSVAEALSLEKRNKKLFSGKAEDVTAILEKHKVDKTVNPMVWAGLPADVNQVLSKHKLTPEYIS